MRTTEDWQYNDEGYKGFYPEFSSNCARCREHQLECISREVARDACAAAVAEHNENVMATVGAAVGVHLAVGPDGQDPPDPYGTESADCFYEKLRSDAGARRLSGGLCFALPDEVYGAGKHAGPSEPERKRGSTSGTEFPEPDWAPWTTVKSESGGHKTVGKSSTYYVNYDAAAHTAFRLMMENAALGDTEQRQSTLYRWLDDVPVDASPVPPPADLPPPPVEAEPLEPPPKRGEYRKGIRGRRAFRREHAEWYERATGAPLEGTLEEQNAQFDKVARRYRSYSDYGAHRSVARFLPARGCAWTYRDGSVAGALHMSIPQS